MGNYYAGYQATLYYVLESVEGVTPTDPAWLNLGQKVEVTISQQPNPNVVALSGSVDNANIQKGIDNPIISFSINPNQSSAQGFLKQFTSTDDSFSLLLQIGTDATPANNQVFARATGCKCKRVANNVVVYPNATTVDSSLEVWGWTYTFDAGTGTPTYEAPDPTVINWSDCTVVKDAVPVTDWWNFNFSVDNDIFRNRDSDGVTTCLKRGRRSVTGSWTRSSHDTQLGQTELDEAKNSTPVTIDFTMNGDDYKFSNSANQEVGVNHPLTEMVGIQQDFIAGQFTIS